MSVSHEIVRLLPYLRRYARLRTGAQSTGDEHVRLCLEPVSPSERIKNAGDLLVELFAVGYDAWDVVDNAIPRPKAQSRIAGSTASWRRCLLSRAPGSAADRIGAVFDSRSYARILDLDEADVVRKLEVARQELRRQAAWPRTRTRGRAGVAMDIAEVLSNRSDMR